MENRFTILRSKWVFGFICLLLFYGLFIIKPDLAVTRLEKELWNLLHLFGFFIAWVFLLNLVPQFAPKNLKRLGLVVLVTVVVSGAIEFVQHYIGRSASVKDIGLNLAGTLVALIIVIFTKKYLRPWQPVVIGFLLVTILGLLWPSTKIFIDELYIAKNFPVLSDFSSPYELSRWEQWKAKYKLQGGEGKKVLHVTFEKDARYSIVALNSFGHEWIKYKQLVFLVHNPGSNAFTTYIRVHDRKHSESNDAYRDRYNREEKIQSGATEISIELLDIYKAPEGRRMNINEIESIMMFTLNLEEQRELIIEKIFLR